MVALVSCSRFLFLALALVSRSRFSLSLRIRSCSVVHRLLERVGEKSKNRGSKPTQIWVGEVGYYGSKNGPFTLVKMDPKKSWGNCGV